MLAENVLTTSGYSAQLRVESLEKAARCVLETNRGEVLAYTPGDREIRRDIDRIDYQMSNETCSVSIRSANSTHAGVWRMTAYTVARDEHGRKKTDTRDDNATAARVFAFNLYVQVNFVLHRPRPVLPNFVGHRTRRARGRRSAKLVAVGDANVPLRNRGSINCTRNPIVTSASRYVGVVLRIIAGEKSRDR